jgi:CheY-like chemotaxis protein
MPPRSVQDAAPVRALSILVVDDVQEFREMYSRYFSFEGVGVTTALDGSEALEIARRYPPEAIVLDLSMPGMNGWDFLRHARADERLQAIPIVVITAYGRQGTEREALAAGADAFLAKPCTPARLLEEVRRVVARARS